MRTKSTIKTTASFNLPVATLNVLRNKAKADHRSLSYIANDYLLAGIQGLDDAQNGDYMGPCESCGGPIFFNEKYNRDAEGVIWHKKCPENKP